MADLILGSTTAITESGGTVTLDSGILFPTGHVIKIHAFHDQSTVTAAANGTGVQIITQDFTEVEKFADRMENISGGTALNTKSSVYSTFY